MFLSPLVFWVLVLALVLLVLVFLLIDIRHEPSANDKMMYDWIIQSGFTPVIIATKADKIKRSQLQKNLKIIRTKLEMGKDDLIFPFSALSKQGKDEIWEYIESMLTPEDEATENTEE